MQLNSRGSGPSYHPGINSSNRQQDHPQQLPQHQHQTTACFQQPALESIRHRNTVNCETSSGVPCSPRSQGVTQQQQLSAAAAAAAALNGLLAGPFPAPITDLAVLEQLLAVATAAAPAGQQYSRASSPMDAGNACSSPSRAILQLAALPAAAQPMSPRSAAGQGLPEIISSPRCPFGQATCQPRGDHYAMTPPPRAVQPPRPATPSGLGPSVTAPTAAPNSYFNTNFNRLWGFGSMHDHPAAFSLQDAGSVQHVANPLQPSWNTAQTQPQPGIDSAELNMLPDWLQAEVASPSRAAFGGSPASINTTAQGLNTMAIGGDRAALQSPASTTSTAFRPARTARTAEEFSFAYMAGVLSPRRPASEGGVGSAGSNGKASQPAAASAKGTGFFLSRQAPNASGTEVS